MSNTKAWELLSAHFDAKDVKSFNGAKPGKPERWLSYVEDETVMDRLDEVIGAGNWNVDVEAVDVPHSIVKVTLGIRWPESQAFLTYSDYGYPTNGEQGEGMKEAVSDGIRRTARMAGIARYVYAGEVKASPSGRSPSPSPSQPRPAAPSSGSGAAPSDDDFDMADVDADDHCPKHHVKWYGDAEKGYYHKQEGEFWPNGKQKWCRKADLEKKG